MSSARDVQPDRSADLRELVLRAQSGDAQAFGEIYERYVSTVYRFVYHRTGNHAVTEDLTSETFLRALRAIQHFTWQGREPAAWLITIARNLVADHYKSSRHRLEYATADMRDADGADHDRTADPEGVAISTLVGAELRQALTQLSADQRECIVLRFLLHQSVSATAEALGKQPGAIKALQYRALRALQRRVSGVR